MKLAILSQKGGTGKTTSTLNVSAELVRLGRRVLVVDMDPQGACAISLGLNPDELEPTIYNALVHDTPIDRAIRTTNCGLDIAPANIDLAEAELQLSGTPLREYALRRALDPVKSHYDVFTIDTPPTLGLLTVNAMAAADAVLIPVSTQLLSLRGLSTLLETIEKLRRFKVNEELSILGILPTRYDSRTVHAREVLEYLQRFGDERQIRVFDPIPATVRFDEAPNEQQPFVTLYPDHPATAAYRKVAHVIQTQTA